MRRNVLGIGAKRTITLLIGANETAEAYLLYDCQFPTDNFLLSLLPQGQPFVFRTITDALRSLDVFCTSEKILPKTLFILLLISTRDPSLERHEYETFQIPSSLRDHCYAIVRECHRFTNPYRLVPWAPAGTGMGWNFVTPA